jgi:pyridoxamine 5'-phosphate oxidase
VLPDRPLDQSDLDPDPLVQFERWYSDAVVAGAVRPDAMALATVAADGAPSVRMVLFKGAGPDGFLFYTNYGSRKARDLQADPRAALVFHWPEMHRQIRVEGTTARVGETESATYFASRPRDAQVAAWASRQSEPLPDRETLERRFAELNEEFEGKDVPPPSFWGGFRLLPAAFEFWQGRQHRLHDRFRYGRRAGRWSIERLWP